MLRSFSAISLLSTMFCISACSSLERGSDLARHQLVANQSTKKEVVNQIGLPRATESMANGELEFWYYSGEPISSSYFVPMPFARSSLGPGAELVHFRDLGAKNAIGDEPVVLVCVFNRLGQLVNIYRPEKK